MQLLTAAKFDYVGVVKTLIFRKYVDVNITNKVSSISIKRMHHGKIGWKSNE